MEKKTETIEKLVAPLKDCPSKPVMGLVALAIIIYVSGLNKTIEEQKAFIEANNQSITNLNNAINLQNKFVEEFKQEKIKIDEERQELIEELAIQKEDSINQINTILKDKKPKDCKETEKYLRDAFR